MNANAGSIGRMDAETYLQERVKDQLGYYEKAANKAKRTYMWMQSAIIVLGLLVPVIVNLPASWGAGAGAADLTAAIRAAVTVMSLTLAILSGLLNFRKYGDLWLSYRLTEESIKHEKFLFLTCAGKYSGDTPFPIFVETFESLISTEHSEFRTLIEEARRPKAIAGPHGPAEGPTKAPPGS